MADHDSKADHGKDDRPSDEPSIRQLLHWATGDRKAEGEALADSSAADVTEEEAEEAVKRAHGDLGIDEEPARDHDVATPVDAERVAEEERSD